MEPWKDINSSVTILNAEGITVMEATTTGVLPGTAERECLKQMLSEGDPSNGAAQSMKGSGCHRPAC
ncbi:hypothetical protein FPT12_13750 [Pseudomonas sp. H3(2019)]|nr:hypothetical protein FPT12_13750 [Pseudomonas sp. H3(2019)]